MKSETVGGTSACQRALATPEVVSLVLYWMYHQDDQFYHGIHKASDAPDRDADVELVYAGGKWGVLLRCAQVSKLWHLEALPFLWREPCIYTQDRLHTRFSMFTDFARKQYHANLVQETSLVTLSSSEVARANVVLEGLEFPRLTEVRIYLDGDGEFITKIRGDHVKILDVDPSFDCYPDTYRVSREQMDTILEQLPACFPHAEEVSFMDRCLAFPGTLERFQAQLPHLKVLNKEMVDVGTTEAWEMPSTT